MATIKAIEQKAQRYDEALEKLRSLHDDYDTVSTLIDIKEELENIFPELKESEGERIRKVLKEYFINSFQNNGVAAICGVHIKDILAWLEKQGKNNMGISEATKKKLEDNLNKALEKETAESFNEFLDEQNPAWSEEDEELLNTIINHFKVNVECTDDDDIINWLKSLKDRVQPKQEWSEGDEKTKDNLISELSNLATRRLIKNETYSKYNSWLKSIRQKLSNVERNGKNWKPSDEQMDALSYILRYYAPAATDKLAWDARQTLELMLKQLKKLREE